MKQRTLFVVLSVWVFAAAVAPAGAASFHGYACTKDCSGHKAGYAWAVRRHVTEAAQCGGRSRSFIEGCLARVADVKALRRAP